MSPTTPKRRNSVVIQLPTPAPRRRSSVGSNVSMASSRHSNVSSSARYVKKAGTKKGSDHNDRATMSAYHSKSQKEKKVSDAQIYRTSLGFNRGELKIVRNVTLRQAVANTPGVTAVSDDGFEMQMCTPDRLKSIEGIMFNNKTLSPTELINPVDNAVAATHNLPTFQPVIVHNAYVTYRLKNVSQHKTIVEMFFFHGKGNRSAPATKPWNDYNEVVLNEWRGMTNAQLGYAKADNTMLESSQFNKMWHTERIVFKMEPGEEGFYTKQGPKKYVMHGKDHVTPDTTAALIATAPTWLSPSSYGNGWYTMFRTMNDLTLITSHTGDINVNTAITAGVEHPIHRLPVQATAELLPPFGGVAVEINEHFNLACPDKTLSDQFTTPYRYIHRNRLSYTGVKSDIQVDADNSAVIPDKPT